VSAKSPSHPQVQRLGENGTFRASPRVPTKLVIRHVNYPAPDSERIYEAVRRILEMGARKEMATQQQGAA